MDAVQGYEMNGGMAVTKFRLKSNWASMVQGYIYNNAMLVS